MPVSNCFIKCNIIVLYHGNKLFNSTQIAEIIDERPEEVKQMELFRTGNRWKVIGGNWFFFEELCVS